MTDTTAGSALDRERADLIETLGRHRWFLRYTAQKLTDEQGATRSTASALTLSGLIHHVADTESRWAGFIERGAEAFGDEAAAWNDPDADLDPESRWRLAEGETLADALAHYADVAARTELVIRTVPSLDDEHRSPWRHGSSRTRAGRTAGCCCTSSPRPRSTPVTPTSSASPSTASARWADPHHCSARSG